MQRSLRVFGFVSLIAAASAAEPEPAKMTKLVTETITVKASGEAVAKPKTLYRADKTHLRLEGEPDPEQNTHRLIITNEPDTWMIDLESKTGRHVVDKGPEFVTALPIFWGLDGKPEREFELLEFGYELEYFGSGRAKELGTRVIDGKKCKALSLKTGEHEVVLFIHPKSGLPYRIDLMKFGRLSAAVRYLSYETNLPFNKRLFTPPDGIQMSEANSE